MAANEDLKLTAKAWAEIVIKIWEDKIIKQNIIGKTGELLNSFLSTVTVNSNGDPERIIFAFRYYGRFVDMGVSRNITMDDPRAKKYRKPWFSGTFDSQVDKFADLLEEKYGLKIASAIVESIDVTVN